MMLMGMVLKQEHVEINVILNNSELYISFDGGHLKFLDSTHFLSCGLNKLAEQLSDDQFKYLMTAYPVHWKLLSKKGIYCYDYMNCMERFNETSLSSKEHFLIGCMISMYQRSSISMLKVYGRH